MEIIFFAWIAIGLVSGTLWLVLLVCTKWALRQRFFPDDTAEAPERQTSDRVSVIVPVKDEEQTLEQCLRSLLNQDYPNLGVIAVDDGSRDGTPAILQRLQAEFVDRLRVSKTSELPDGWFGKPNAIRTGVRWADGNWLLLTDADCIYTSNQAISIAVREALKNDADMLTMLPMLERSSVWEQVVEPFCVWVLMTCFQPWKVNDPKNRIAYANGAFILIRRSSYDAVDGHAKVRSKLVEDIELARIVKRAGFRLCVVENRDLYKTRMYESLRAAWHGWSRIFSGAFESCIGLLFFMYTSLTMHVVPLFSVVVAIIGRRNASIETAVWWNLALALWTVVWGLEQFSVRAFFRLIDIRPIWSLTSPIAGAFRFLILTQALLIKLGFAKNTWRGRQYQATSATGRIRQVSSMSSRQDTAPKSTF